MVGNDGMDTIHRFFDSSPFSLDEQTIALTELPRFENDDTQLPFANITLYYTHHGGERVVIDKTLAWGAQLGAQLQIVRNRVFYNVLEFSSSSCRKRKDLVFPSIAHSKITDCHRSLRVHGKIFDISTGEYTDLPCPLYHVSSDGLFTSSFNLWDMQHAQKGYGIDWLGMPPQEVVHSLSHGIEEGIWVNSVQSGQCTMLYSLEEMTNALKLNERGKIFGFHSKWSFDSQWIMVVLRSLETPVLNTNGRVRVQHLAILKNHLLPSYSNKELKYLLSWASKPFLDQRHFASEGKMIVHLCDGNHPNWKANSNIITMNLRLPENKTFHDRRSSWFADLSSSLYSAVSVNVLGEIASVDRSNWKIVEFKAEDAPSDMPLFHTRFQIASLPPFTNNHRASLDSSNLPIRIIAPIGVGHPSYSPDGKYLVTDAYPKEVNHIRSQFPFLNNGVLPPAEGVYVPILLFSTMNLMQNHNSSIKTLETVVQNLMV